MFTIIHDTSNKASKSLHNKFNDIKLNVVYCSEMNVKIESGRRIKEIREKKNLYLKDVCRLVKGLSISRLSNYEQGIRMIPVDQAKQIAAALDTSPEYILTLTDKDTDQRERQLIQMYRECDARGKNAILRMAHQERQISNGDDDDTHQMVSYAGPDRRKDRH